MPLQVGCNEQDWEYHTASCLVLSTGNYKPQGQRSALYLVVSGRSKLARLHCNV